jgi:alkylation response protein AidB-like acyl-CoA dehydrogenase
VEHSQQLLQDAATRVFRERFGAPLLRRAAQGEWLGSEWAALEELGLPQMMAGEADGGSGFGIRDALGIVALTGTFAVPLPLAETLLANWLITEAALVPHPGVATIAAVQGAAPLSLERSANGWTVCGKLNEVPWGRHATHVITLASHGAGSHLVRLIPQCGLIRAGRNLAGMPRDDIILDAVSVSDADAASSPLAGGLQDLLALYSALRTVQISGALSRITELTVQYASERIQFGKPLAKFQITQQNLAILAEQRAIAQAAATIASAAFGTPVDLMSLAAAKAAAGEAAGEGARIAHQIFGAIGFTEDHVLHFFTQSLWAWRDEGGNESIWSRLLGKRAAAGGADGYWPVVTAALPSSPAAETLRVEVRSFLAEAMSGKKPIDRAASWMGWDRGFSRAMGSRGWIGMTWPARYGGAQRSHAERYVVLEEMLAAGAPVAAHWVADRQSGPLLLKFGTEAQRNRVLPDIAAGNCSICIGMSEPGAGSDLAAVKTKATTVSGGFRVSGTKLWTTNAQRSHFMILLCRTGISSGERHEGLSQLLIDMSTPGIKVRPIGDASGAGHFNEVVFDEVFVPADALLGQEGEGWAQVTSELALERSGPERYLSSFPLLIELLRVLGEESGDQALIAVGRLTAKLMVLRQMSREIADLLQAGENPLIDAAIVKDIGNSFEQEIPEVVRWIRPASAGAAGDDLAAVLAFVTLAAPSFSLRGGTREILRGIIARSLGVR